MAQRRIFSPEFKSEAVRLVNERGVSITQAAKDLDIHYNLLRKWIVEAKDRVSSDVAGAEVSEKAEMRRLRREVSELKMERDILKKAAAYFAKDQL
jgi:transposase